MNFIDTGLSLSVCPQDNFYESKESFPIFVDVIATTRNKGQFNFASSSSHRYHADADWIECVVLQQALQRLWLHAARYREGELIPPENIHREMIQYFEPELETLSELVKLSCCVHFMEKYKKKETDKINQFLDRQEGKWWFQPDRRCEVVRKAIDVYPRIAHKVFPFAEEVA